MKTITAKTFTTSLILALALSACTSGGKMNPATEAASEVNQLSQQTVNAVLWYNTSAENTYIYEQTYRMARQMLDLTLKNINDGRQPAVVIDIDETVLDNSPYMLSLIKNNAVFSEETWAQWVLAASAKALPGAKEFLGFCEERGIQVFYVSNRSNKYLEPTLQNLQQQGLPYADESHILLMEDSSDKTERRLRITNEFNVLLYMGDNLLDFDQIFADRSNGYGKGMVKELLDQTLPTHILFPNPMYGQWEKAFNVNRKLSPADQATKKIEEAKDSDY